MRTSPIRLWRQKLAPPHPTFPVVPRAHADELAASHERVGLVLVHAPAGFGKTSLLRSIYEARRHAGQRVGWLSLDAADNDPQRFLEYMDAALRDEYADEAATFERVVANVSELIGSHEGFSIFLDDVQVITDPTVNGLIRELSTAVPGHGTLFLGGRRMPELQIGRLRSNGQVVEIGADQLRFTASESEELLANIAGRRLEPDVVASLHERTEGWAAVLQLAGLTLGTRGDHADYVAGFSGSSAELGSYLAEEIVATQPDEIRQLLLRSSICETISAELCDELCGTSSSDDLLRQVERENLCLFRLDEQGEWFRFHDLFADYLRRELQRYHGDEVPGLHRRAAEWFAGHDKKTSALDHALQSGDTAYAADMADSYAQPLVAAGRLNTLIRAVQPLPKAALEPRPRLKVYYTICLTGAFQHRTAAPLIEELDTPQVMASLDPVTRGALLFAIPFQMILQDRFADALAASEANLPQLDESDAQGRTALNNTRNVCLLHLRRYQDIDEVASEVRALATGVTTYGLAYAECLAGMSELAQGRLSHATAIFEAALSTAVGESSANSAATAIAAACLAEALYEAGRIERAQELLDRYLTTITHLAIPDGVIHAHTHHIRIAYRQRGYQEACEAINELKRLGYERDLSRVVATSWAEHSRLALLRGDMTAAERYLNMAETHGPYTTLWDESSATLRARLLTAQGRAGEALALLDSELADLDTDACRRYALKLRIVRAVALRAAGRTTEALSVLAECVSEALRESHVGVLVDEGAPVSALLRELLATRAVDTETRGFIDSLLAHVDAPQAPEAEAHQTILSTRELEVLGKIADGLSNQAIADTLIISLPTVKTHVRSILSKLDAKNRTEAVAAARRRNLLGR